MALVKARPGHPASQKVSKREKMTVFQTPFCTAMFEVQKEKTSEGVTWLR
jgi:hypothetical protein